MERLDKFLVAAGIGSRSQVKDILKAGRITVDGSVERDNSRKIDPGKQTVCLDGESLSGRRFIVCMLNKPAGFVTATEDKQDHTVMELLPPEYLRQEVKPVGRLDKATEGLLLFTNDGDLLHRLISPKRKCPRSTMPGMRVRQAMRMWLPSPPVLPCETARSAFRRNWSLWEQGRAASPYAKENTTRSGG